MPLEEEETVAVTAKTGDVVDVTIHPLVLLSAADHYHRVARGTRKRVVGLLLGSVSRGRVDATNSFAVPFEEDSRNPVGTCNVLLWTVVNRLVFVFSRPHRPTT
jgi:JAB1/Mov34/MPN/PAD-1 ubiquitin protease